MKVNEKDAEIALLKEQIGDCIGLIEGSKRLAKMYEEATKEAASLLPISTLLTCSSPRLRMLGEERHKKEKV